MSTHFTLDKLLTYLQSEELEPEIDQEQQTVELGIAGDNGDYHVGFELNEVEGYFTCGVHLPIEPDLAQLPQIYEATARANHLLPMGGFQVSDEDQAVMFVLGVPIDDGDLSDTQLEDILGFALECADTYLPAFIEILAGEDVREALERAENPPEPEV